MAATPSAKVVTARPAESLTIAGALAFLVARSLGVDNDATMTALTMVIGFTPAAVTWLVQLISSGRPQTSTPAETPPDAVAEALKDLNKALAEAIAAMRPPEPKKSVVDAADLVDAVRLVLAADKTNGKTGDQASQNLVADALKDLNKTLADALAAMRPSEPKRSPLETADLVDAVRLVLAAVKTNGKTDSQEPQGPVADALKDLNKTLAKAIASIRASVTEKSG